MGVRILTSVMAPEEYGKLALTVSVALGFVYSFGEGMGAGIIRFFPVARSDGKAEWYWGSIRKTLTIFYALTLALAVILAGVAFLAGLKIQQIILWELIIVFGGVLVINRIGISLHAGARNRKTVCWHQVFLEWGRFIGAFGLLYVWCEGAEVILIGFILVTVIAVISQWFWAKKLIFLSWPVGASLVDRSKDFSNYLTPLFVSGFLLWLQTFSDRWALKTFCSLKDVGIYFALYQISYAPLAGLSAFLFNFLIPVFSGIAGDGNNQKRYLKTIEANEKVAILVFWLVLAGVAVAFLFTIPICHHLVSDDYQDGFWALPWILASGGLYAVALQLTMSFYSGIDTRAMILLRTLSSIFSCVFYMVGAFFFGFSGVVFGGLLFSVIFLIAMAITQIRLKRKLM